MAGSTDHRTRIAIIGGGAAGAITACELARIDAAVDVDVIERAGDVGPGLAYSTIDPLHVVNVWAGRMSADPDDPDHLVRWLATRGEDARPESFPQRRMYGRYLRELFAERTAAASTATFTTIRATVTTLSRVDAGIELTLSGVADRANRPRTYDAAVLALGNVDAPPALELPTDARCYASPWQAGALDAAGLPTQGSVLIVGTGLTAVDAALSLADHSPGMRITMTSRNGRLPFAHLQGPLRTPAPHDGFRTDCTTFDELASQWRAHEARALDAGFDWRAAVDGIRPITQQLWRQLAVDEQRRFLVERRRWWEARRNRAAPQVGAALDALVASGRLHVVAGGVDAMRAAADGVHVMVGGDERRFDRVVSCTGPTADVMRTTNPLLRRLLASGIVAPDPHRLAIRTDADGAVLAPNGATDTPLYTLGWLRRGELWETLAIPEIRVQAKVIAGALCNLVV